MLESGKAYYNKASEIAKFGGGVEDKLLVLCGIESFKFLNNEQIDIVGLEEGIKLAEKENLKYYIIVLSRIIGSYYAIAKQDKQKAEYYLGIAYSLAEKTGNTQEMQESRFVWNILIDNKVDEYKRFMFY